jgi:hypothetical protein
MEQKRPVHQGIMLKTTPGVQVPRVFSVNALIVTLHAFPQPPHPREQSHEDDDEVDCFLQIQFDVFAYGFI